MLRLIRFVFISLFSLSLILPAYCQDKVDNKEVKTVEGQVVSIDWVASLITVRWFDNRPGYAYDEITFTVTRDTKITKGTEKIGLADINIDDDVTVQYYNDSLSGLKAISIVVEI